MDSQVKEKEKSADIEQNKVVGILSYIIFFLPLLIAKESKFAMYHANQGLLLLLLAIAINAIGTIVPILGWLIVLPVGNLLLLALFIIGLINSSKGEMKPLPLIGKYTIIKLPESN
ncbi:hypothetical protein [Halobacillus litoralis]|uniref:hypothetical protein n=1 Tax=Halobacillus litoralis TaxID=45668 RepID=UPI001CFE8169|nr:hypothetical protein [Halobacillus litoralis]